MAIHLRWDSPSSTILICDELLRIFLRSYSNASLVFASFVILFHDFRSWIFPLQLWIRSLFMSLLSAFQFSSCSSKVWFPFRHFLHYIFFSHPSYVAVQSQPLCLYSFRNVLSLQSFLDLWFHQLLMNSFHYFLRAFLTMFLSNLLSFSSSCFVRIIVSAPYVTTGRNCI